MKNLFTIIILSFSLSLSVNNLMATATGCNAGNETNLFALNSGNQPDYLLGTKFTVATGGTLTGLSLYGLAGSGSNVQMALYYDNAGVPGALVTTSATGAVVAGPVTLAVTPQAIAPGDYWIMAVYDVGGAVTHLNDTTSKTVYYTSLTYGSAMPTDASGFTSYTGQDFNYWMDISCSTANGCDVGNETNLFLYDGGFSSDFILGTKFTVTTGGTLTGLSLYGLAGSGSNVQMALYADNAGVPGNLVTTSAAGAVVAGPVTLAVTPQTISPGDYWIMAIYDVGGATSYLDTSTTKTVYYTSLTYGSAMPPNASGFTSYTGQDFNYWMDIACTTANGCDAGNETNLFPLHSDHGSDFLLGTKFTVYTAGTLTGLSLYGLAGSGSNVQMALYYDNAGVPGDLVTTSATGAVVAGPVTLAVSPQAINPGDYWIMAVYDVGGAVTYLDTATTKTVYYTSLTYGSAMPANASGFTSYTGQDFNYWIDISCSTANGCNAGNETNLFLYNGGFASDFILGTKFTVTTAGTLTGLSLYGLAGDFSNVQMALYADNAGVPGNLVATSDTGAVVAGPVNLAVTPQAINPGDYWIMAVYDVGNAATYLDTASTKTVYYTALTYGSAMPANASGFTSYTGQDFNYWMDIACITTAIDEHSALVSVTGYPNPTSGNYLLDISSAKQEKLTLEIYNGLGSLMMSEKLLIDGTTSFSINMSAYRSGVYFYRLLDDQGNKMYTQTVVKE